MHLRCNEKNCQNDNHLQGVQVFLLVLIVIGVGLLITQSAWVPKLVNYILLHQK